MIALPPDCSSPTIEFRLAELVPTRAILYDLPSSLGHAQKCSADEALCRTDRSIKHGDAILVGQRWRGFVCAWNPDLEPGKAGWLKSTDVRVGARAAPPPMAWRGQWTHRDRATAWTLDIRRSDKTWRIRGQGEFFYQPKEASFGEFFGTARQVADHLVAKADPGSDYPSCELALWQVDGKLIAASSGDCAGDVRIDYMGTYARPTAPHARRRP